MYHFNIVRQDSGEFRFELDGINLIIDGYDMRGEKHWIQNPETAIAFFSIRGHLYGVSNKLKTSQTVEDFFDLMRSQYQIFMAAKMTKRDPAQNAANNGRAISEATDL